MSQITSSSSGGGGGGIPATTTNHTVQVGNVAGTLTSLAVGTTGKYLRGVTTSDPIWSTLTLPNTVALGDVLVASATNVVGVVNDVANAGYVLTVNVGGAPSFQSPGAGGIATLDGDSGTATGATVTIAGTTNQITTTGDNSATVTLSTPSTFIAPGTIAATTTVTAGTGITITTGDLTFTNDPSATNARIIINGKTWFSAYDSTGVFWTNMFWGYQSGNVTGTGIGNVGYGPNVLKSLTSGVENMAFGLNCLQACTSGSNNVAVSNSAMYNLTTGSNNTGIGPTAPLQNISTGSYNTAIGVSGSATSYFGSGVSHTGSDSSNIELNHSGVAGQNNTLHIGQATGPGNAELNAAYIAGIYGVTPGGASIEMAIIDANGQLGSQAIPGGGGMTWTTATADVTPAVVNTGYLIKHATPATELVITLPTTSALYDEIEINGYTAGLWKLQSDTGLTIHFGTVDTTPGATGYLEATNRYDCIKIRCVVANAEWQVVSSQGNITIF
jgi:hypothetical protein